MYEVRQMGPIMSSNLDKWMDGIQSTNWVAWETHVITKIQFNACDE